MWRIFSYIALFVAFARGQSCDPGDVRDCLARFEYIFNACPDNDTDCRCSSVVTSGISCFLSCPEAAMHDFVLTYSDGLCSDLASIIDFGAISRSGFAFMDPLMPVRKRPIRHGADLDQSGSTNELHPSRIEHSESVENAVGDDGLEVAPTITQGPTSSVVATNTATSTVTALSTNSDSPEIFYRAADSSETTMQSPEEYRSSVELSRFKSMLRSLRSASRASVAHESSIAAAGAADTAGVTAVPASAGISQSHVVTDTPSTPAPTLSAHIDDSSRTGHASVDGNKEDASGFQSPTYLVSLVWLCLGAATLILLEGPVALALGAVAH